MLKSLVDRFWDKFDRPEEGCWEWQTCKDKRGYGHLGNWPYGTRLAHRVSWMLWYGPIPDGLDVLHRCDNPPCVRPDHLFLGTHQDNMNDMITKGRAVHASGAKHARAKLTDTQVNHIRELYSTGQYTTRALAAQFGISCVHAWRIGFHGVRSGSK